MKDNRIKINKLAYDRIVFNEHDLVEMDRFLKRVNLSEQEGNMFSITEGVVTFETSIRIYGTNSVDFYFHVDDNFDILIIGLNDKEESFYQGKVRFTKSGFNINVIQKTVDHNITKKAIESSLRVLMDFMMYTHLKQSNINIKVLKKNPFVPKGDDIPKKANKTSRNVVKLSEGKTVYKYENTDSESIDGDKRTYERQVESWSVRGHYRNLKSGGRVWIKGYKKGEGKTKGKDYTI